MENARSYANGRAGELTPERLRAIQVSFEAEQVCLECAYCVFCLRDPRDRRPACVRVSISSRQRRCPPPAGQSPLPLWCVPQWECTLRPSEYYWAGIRSRED